jgi:hypothetical protein
MKRCLKIQSEMVKEENVYYHMLNKYVVTFMNSSSFASNELISEWKSKSNIRKLKSVIKKSNKPRNPLRPKSEYIFFCEEIRPLIQEEMKGLNIHDITCELGRRWRQFKSSPEPEMKMRISKLAEIDKTRYHTEKEAINKNTKKANNHLRSKYLYFCKEEREKNPKITLTRIADLWAANQNDAKLADRYEAAKASIKISQKKEVTVL